MSRKKLRNYIVGVVLSLAFYGVVLFIGLYSKHDWARPMKEVLPIALAVPTAIVAAAFNRHASYLQALRELWKQLLPAIQSAIQYTHKTAPSDSDFSKDLSDLAISIDLIRGVFKNVPKPGTPRGLFPYENLKDIYNVVSWLGYGNNFRSDSAREARKCITELWQEMHHSMLREFDRDVPLFPVGKYITGSPSCADTFIEKVKNTQQKPQQDKFRLSQILYKTK